MPPMTSSARIGRGVSLRSYIIGWKKILPLETTPKPRAYTSISGMWEIVMLREIGLLLQLPLQILVLLCTHVNASMSLVVLWDRPISYLLVDLLQSTMANVVVKGVWYVWWHVCSFMSSIHVIQPYIPSLFALPVELPSASLCNSITHLPLVADGDAVRARLTSSGARKKERLSKRWR